MDLSELRKEPHLSATGIQDYIDCSLLYKFSRIDKLPPDFRSDSLEFGKVMHKVLQERYQQKKIGNLLSAKDLHDIFEEILERDR